MDKHKELQKIQEKIDKNYSDILKDLCEQKSKLQDEIEKIKGHDMLGKTFTYKDNSYSCPSKKSDYWNIHLKVIDTFKDGIIVLTVEKDSYGCIQIETKKFYNYALHGYEPCPEKEFNISYKKLLGEIQNGME